MKNIIKKFISDHFYIQIANMFFIFLGFIIRKYLFTYGLKSDYGNFNVLINVISTLSILFTSSFPTYIVYKISKNKMNLNEFYGITILNLILCLFTISIFVLFPNFIGKYLFENKNLYKYLPLIGIILPIYLIQGSIVSYFNGKKLFKQQAIILSFINFTKFIFIFILTPIFAIKGSLLSYGIAPIIVMLILITFYQNNKEINLNEILKSTKYYFFSKKMWAYIIPIVMFTFLSNAILTKDILIVENVFNSKTTNNTQLSTYSAITDLSRAPIFVFLALGAVFFPVYSSTTDINKLKKTFIKDLIIEIVLGLFIILFYIIFGKLMLSIIYSKDLIKYNNVLILSLISSIIYSIMSLICIKLQALNKTIIPVINIVISLIILQFVGKFMIQKYELLGASLNLIISCLPTLIFLIIYTFLQFKKNNFIIKD